MSTFQYQTLPSSFESKHNFSETFIIINKLNNLDENEIATWKQFVIIFFLIVVMISRFQREEGSCVIFFTPELIIRELLPSQCRDFLLYSKDTNTFTANNK